MSDHDPVPARPAEANAAADGAQPVPDAARAGSDAPRPASDASIDTLAAVLRRDSADLEIYVNVLTNSLADALPPGSVTVARRRGLSDRLAGRPGTVQRLEVTLSERRLILTLADGHPQGEVATVVRGVVLSREPVELDQWAEELAAAVSLRARSDARARAALEKLLLGG
jgi:hypothetical protein